MHFCRICRTEKNLKYTVKELRKFSRKRCNDGLLCTTPTLGNICNDCEERLHNFHRLDENEDNEERIIVDDDDLLYNLFFEKVEQQRIMKRLMSVGAGSGGSDWCTSTLRQQTLVAATAGVAINSVDEVIEVLTSRENTPSPALPLASTPNSILQSETNVKTCPSQNDDQNTSSTIMNTNISTSITPTTIMKNVASPISDNISSYKVVAVIDLDDDEEVPLTTTGIVSSSNFLTPQITPDTDEEEIVFRKVDPDDIKKPKNKTRKRKKCRKEKYQHREINLIASLSLLSSDNDSDVDVTDPEYSPEKANITPKLTEEQCVSTTQISPDLKSSDLPKTPSTQPLEGNVPLNNCLDAAIKCPVCQTEFATSQRLIHHMRRKHRTYDGEVLSERPRCSQDSAMTIRLRYMQRYTYYECQLCGCIDAIFKTHKEHVMQKHAEESKSLNDPMMQILKCPICKEKCGAQHVLLLRHLLQSHKAAECRSHFRQITHVRNLFSNCGARKEKELQRTTRIYQMSKKKQYFFECLQCHKIITGYFNYLKHQSTHTKTVNKKNIGVDNSHSDSVIAAVSRPVVAPGKPKQNCIEPKVKLEKPKPVQAVKEISTRKKLASQQTNAQKNANSQPRRERKLTKKAIQAALVKVKVKPPLKQLPTHRYNCKLCAQSFKGFHRLNLHILQLHTSKDGHIRCDICLLRFADSHELEEHVRKRHIFKQKRKITAKANCAKPRRQYSLSNRMDRGPPDPKFDGRENSEIKGQEVMEATWLQELLALADQKRLNLSNNVNKNNIKRYTQTIPERIEYSADQQKLSSDEHHTFSMFFTSQQCFYCAHLFRNVSELHSHEKMHVERHEAQMLKRCQIDKFLSS
ncbi:PREDICTED: uncharacterized protein LOC108369643 [Rhagoletis zephyria]|uniref:uncharacterized protein LOC108369643 n=1 Tax=Rhagoletis zephyria TaxID=28612 RepID=UPI0008116DCB|nr:PREDICTED: uncharacterized protein LOC108369643 [Rhagoletis zephyria]